LFTTYVNRKPNFRKGSEPFSYFDDDDDKDDDDDDDDYDNNNNKWGAEENRNLR
jgi:hypothetical protein